MRSSAWIAARTPISRHAFLTLRRQQQLIAAGILATRGPGLPFAIAAQFASPVRQVVAIVGDGGFAMLMAELSTAVRNQLSLKGNRNAQQHARRSRVRAEEFRNPPYGCELGGIDFAQVAMACDAHGFRCKDPATLRASIAATLASRRTALLELHVDPAEPISMPHQLKA
ncbi:hypothetical protein BTH42_32660 [Burkholderia sp. SRS-W-2-2016]|uniref:thiamine pyrophosphate-dependent enzyme n=1 Tax=Burkholderia sp. SRS-W-2-2016 TaxID=1926878 RepID=UPI00094ADDB5|nr:thiamine pyrophosphate-dependent enzyme [Burkholderia sp. SRS-W-2-2016]OLL27575.1 hypothetical protein BTH42_32660 [Burkholderia sp. SRS-W-2-2016]